MQEPKDLIPSTAFGMAGVKKNIDQLGSEMHKAIDKVSDAARPAIDRMASGAHRITDNVADAGARSAEALEAKSEQIKDAQTRLLQDAAGYARANPAISLGIAVAAGFLLGRLFSSR
ncbi:MAG: hypothetical protein WCB36_04020 [Burkholderiales bacterium]